MKNLHLNCDMGESYGNFKIGNDDAIFPYITACNIACGFHGGDPLHIEETVKKAIAHNIVIGAHPSYPDLAGFGRRKMQISPKELKAIIKYQIAAVKGICESLGGTMKYVKPHGALYNTCAIDKTETLAVIEAIREIDNTLALMGLAGSMMESIAQSENMPFIAEAFADRRYTSDGKLQPRSEQGAVIHNAKIAAEQVRSIVQEGRVYLDSYRDDNQWIELNAQSFCIHGDNPYAVDILKAIHNINFEF